MCGIAGVFGRADVAAVEQMIAALVHRGPDDGLVVGGKLSLGDCALMPMLFFVVTLGAPMGLGANPLSEYPNLAAAWVHAGRNPVLSKVADEMGAALAKMQGG